MTQDIVPHEVADSLNRRPIIETIEAQRLALLKAEVAPKASPGEVGVFLEIAARYDLDPFAKEIWCAGEPGKIMIMVGRDGLRKIAHRAGLRFDGDVVRERDYFKVTRNPDRTRSVAHRGRCSDCCALVCCTANGRRGRKVWHPCPLLPGQERRQAGDHDYQL